MARNSTSHRKLTCNYRSITQRNSWERLEVSRVMLEKILTKHNVMPEFFETLYSFRDRCSDVEEAFAGTRCCKMTGPVKGGD